MAAMRADGIEIAENAAPAALEPAGDAHRLRLADGRTLGPFDCVIWAIGREPNAEGLGLAEAGVALGRWGEVVTDFRQDTNVAGIHAIGDVTGARRTDAGRDRGRAPARGPPVRRPA